MFSLNLSATYGNFVNGQTGYMLFMSIILTFYVSKVIDLHLYPHPRSYKNWNLNESIFISLFLTWTAWNWRAYAGIRVIGYSYTYPLPQRFIIITAKNFLLYFRIVKLDLIYNIIKGVVRSRKQNITLGGTSIRFELCVHFLQW